MTKEEIISMASEAGFKVRNDTIRTMHSNGSWVGINEELERFAELVEAAERKALANEFSEAVTKTLESLAATTLMPSPPMPTVIKNLNAIAAAVAAEREACAKVLDEMADEAEADMEPSALVTYYREKASAIRARGNA